MGKVTIIVESDSIPTDELERLLRGEVDHMRSFGFSRLDEAEFYVVPSDEE